MLKKFDTRLCICPSDLKNVIAVHYLWELYEMQYLYTSLKYTVFPEVDGLYIVSYCVVQKLEF